MNALAHAADGLDRAAFPVIGIGASAGAIGALTRLFEGLPAPTGMAFVVVVHLSPDHDSHLAAILGNLTTMAVRQVTESVRLEPDHVYVISPTLQLQMVDGRLDVLQVAKRTLPPAAIDLFLRSLGDAHAERAIGVVLSGMGSDGALGLRRIKERGGVTLAQSPDDAEFDAMPANAVATGAVDFVLPAAQIGPKLIAVWDNARRIELPEAEGLELRGRKTPPEGAGDATRALRQILRLLRERTGHDFEHYKPATVLRRLERRLQVTGRANLPEYAGYLQEHADETAALLKDLLISVTNFFRDAESFEALGPALDRVVALPRLIENRVRVWVAGCATGEEAFSIAMLLAERGDPRGDERDSTADAQIFATDIDERAIAVARTGLYPETIAADVSAQRLRRFFQREPARLRVRKELREKVLFATHNLLRDPPFSNLDLVCCRNLLIYLDREVQQQVLQVLHFALRPGGLLFLGSAESADPVDGLFSAVDKRHRIYRAEPVARPQRSLPAMPWNVRLALPPAMRDGLVPNAGVQVSASLHDRLREAHLPASVVIDDAYNVLHSSPDTTAYLRFAPGMPSRHLLDLVRSELAVELRIAVFKAWEDRQVVEARRVCLTIGDERAWIAMVARPAEHEGARYLLITFDRIQVTLMPVVGGDDRDDPAVATLEKELEHLREELRDSLSRAAVSTEELRASNEELQSINEELRSTTEELETSKEELQSVNEELITVNQELTAKVDEAGLANDDLTNLISSTEIATIFVDRSMRIKRFTPRASALFNLIAADAGRSLLDITHRLAYERLEADAVQAFETLQVVEREVVGQDGSTYLVRVLPYRTRQDVIDGAVLTFIDISGVRRAEQRMREGEANLRLLVESTKEFAILTMNVDGRVTTWNDGAQRLFGYASDEIIGEPIDRIFTPDDRAVGVPQQEMATARSEGRASDERWHLRKDGGTFYASGVMTAMREHGRLVGFAKIARDVTDHKRAELRIGASLSKETEMRAELQRAIAMKDEFLAVMSHELKHPLNLIHVNAELLARLPEARQSAAVAQAAGTIRKAVLSQARITDDLLDLSRLRTGKLVISPVAVDWAAVVRRVAEAVAGDAQAKPLTIELDAPAGDAITVQADPVRVEQIVWNLVSNALKFTRAGGRIALRLGAEGGDARLDVTDDGQGIGPDFLPHVFELFRQADRSTTRAHGGMGIGLALVKHLVEEQGGHVAVTSEGVGHGATFSVWLPLVAPVGAPVAAAPPLPALGGLRILVVDDTVDALESFAALLGLEGAAVTAVTSGAAALEAVERERFDVVLSDVAMPGMDGYTLVAQLRQRPQTAGTPAIALTGFGRSQDVQRALEAGFDAHLAKPVALDQLVETLALLRPPATPPSDGA